MSQHQYLPGLGDNAEVSRIGTASRRRRYRRIHFRAWRLEITIGWLIR